MILNTSGRRFDKRIKLMFMEEFGYVVAELPVLILIVWLAARIVQWRRARANRPRFDDDDRRTLFQRGPYAPDTWEFYPRFALAVLAVMILGFLQITILAAFGAAILSAALILTSAAIVHGLLLER